MTPKEAMVALLRGDQIHESCGRLIKMDEDGQLLIGRGDNWEPYDALEDCSYAEGTEDQHPLTFAEALKRMEDDGRVMRLRDPGYYYTLNDWNGPQEFYRNSMYDERKWTQVSMSYEAMEDRWKVY